MPTLPTIFALGFLVQLAPHLKPSQDSKGPASTSAILADEINLSPATWPAWEQQAYSNLQQSYAQPSSLATSKTGMVSGTSAALAVHAGLKALDAGGNAMDAALTTALAQVVLNGGCWNSYAGILNLIYYDAKTGKITTLNGGYNIPIAETNPETIASRPNIDGRSVFVGGFFPALEAAHTKHGKLPFKSLFDPALYFSEHGFPVDPILAALIQQRQRILSRNPNTFSIFEGSPGQLLQAGEIFKQPELTKTLQIVAEKGADGLYRGDWAKEVAKKVQALGGTISAEDFAAYRPIWEEAQSTSFAGYQVYSLGQSELGATQLIEGLALAKQAGLTQSNTDTESPDTKNMLMQISKLSHLLSSGCVMTGKERDDLANLYLPHLQTAGWEISRLEMVQELQSKNHSDSVVAWDSDGNVAALVHSINTSSWGNLGLFVGGVSIPDSGNFQQHRAQHAGPGNRLTNLTNPVIVLKNKKPHLAAGAIGAGLHEVMLQNLVSILVGQMDPHKADRLPKFWGINYQPTPLGQFAFYIQQGEFSTEFLAEIIKHNQPLTPLSATEIISRKGYWVGIRKTKQGLEGSSPHYFNGTAEGQ